MHADAANGAPLSAASVSDGGDAMLHELACLCMDLVRDLAASAKATADEAVKVSLVRAVTSLARAVRQTRLLEAKLADGSALRERAAAAADDGRDPVAEARLRKVRHVLAEGIDKSPVAERPEIWERLDAAIELERGFPERPIIESVMRIARALGIRREVTFFYSDEWDRRAAEEARIRPAAGRWRRERPP